MEKETNIFSLAAENSSSTGLSIYTKANPSRYEVRVATMEGLAWSLANNRSGASHDWKHVTVTWHEMWGLKLYINGETTSKTNEPEFISTVGLLKANHIRIGGAWREDGNVSSLPTNLQMSDLRIWERFVYRPHVMTNYHYSLDVTFGLWYVMKKATFQTEGVVQHIRWVLRSGNTPSSFTGPNNDGLTPAFPPHCFTALGLENGLITNSKITSSSHRGAQFQSHEARLHSAGCWSSADQAPWIEVKLNMYSRITRVATQGNPNQDEWVTEYTIQTKTAFTSSSPLRDYPSDGTLERFIANSDRSTVVTNYLSVSGLVVRINPTQWQIFPSLRLELYGCYRDARSFKNIESSYPRVRGEKVRMLTLYATESHNCLKFRYHMKGSTIGRLNVYIRRHDRQELLIWRLAGSQGVYWQWASVPIESNYPYQIIFEGVIGDGYTGDIAVDDVMLGIDKSCSFTPASARQGMSGINSKMLESSPFYQDKLNLWLTEEGFGDKYWIPCFRGVEDGWNASVFDSLCAKKEATVTIIRKGNCLFGGFADKPWASVSGFIPSTKAFVFTLQSTQTPSSLQAKWTVSSDKRFHAFIHKPGTIQFGGDIIMNVTNRSVNLNIGDVYGKANSSLFCEDQHEAVQISDVEVLSPLDTLCDPPCLHGQYCDEISGKCICDDTKRDVQRCFERAELQAKLDEYCQTIPDAPIAIYARFDVSLNSKVKLWRCYIWEALTGDRARFNRLSSDFYTRNNHLTAIIEDYPSLKLETLLLTAKYYFPLDNLEHVYTSKDNYLSWTTAFTGQTTGPKDDAVFTNGEPYPIFLFNDTGCISNLDLCVQGLTISLWLKHTNREAEQTFLTTRGIRIFQLNGSFDHIAVQLRHPAQTCLWVYRAPQNIWSHFVITFDSSVKTGSCNSLSFFFNGVKQSPLFSDVLRQKILALAPTVQIGDASSGLPTASFDELIIWYDTYPEAVIGQVFKYYRVDNYAVNIELERKITGNQGQSYYSDLEKMESVSSSLITEINSLVGEYNVSSVAVRKYGYTQTSNLKTHSAYATVVFNESSGEVLDLLQVGTILPSSWTLVNIQSNDVDVHGVTFTASNKTDIASINVTVMISSVESLSGIYNGYIIFYKEVDEDRYRTERLVSARSSHLITGLKNWTSYLIFIRVETLNGIGRKSDTKLVWTKPIAPSNVTVTIVNNSLLVQWTNLNTPQVIQYRVLASPASDPLNISCEVTVPAELGGVAICDSLEHSVNYSVRVAGEGAVTGTYSAPVFIFYELDACLYYKILNGSDRSKGQGEGKNCDRNLTKAWYRFQGAAGTQMSNACLSPRQCSTHAPGWLFGMHPAVSEGAVYRRVCFSGDTCCQWSFDIRVRNCSSYYVYNFVPTPTCTLWYCGVKAPPAPRNLSILSLSPTSVCFGWEDQSSGVDHYAIEYSVVSEAQLLQPVEISPVIQSHAMIQSLQPNTTYMIQVAGLSSNLKGPFSDTVNIIPALNAFMNQPSNVTVFSSGNHEIMVCWQKSPSQLVTGYLLSWSNVNGSGRLEQNMSLSSNDSKYIVSNLTTHDNYSVQVSLISKCGLGFKSELLNVTAGKQSPVQKMSAVRAYSTSNNTIHAEWTLKPSPLVEGYFVELIKRSHGLIRNVTLNSSSSFVDFTSLETSSNYSVQVASFTWCHYGVKSDPLFASTDNIPPPSNFRAEVSIAYVLLHWGSVSFYELEGYNVSLSTDGYNETYVVNSTTTSLKLTNLEAQTEYRFQVQAFSVGRIGPLSELVIVSTYRDAPEIISAEALSPVAILLEWSNMTSQDLVGYKVMYRNLDSNGTQLNITVEENSTSLKLENLEPASNYSIQVAFVLVDYLGILSDPLFVVTEELLTIAPSGFQGSSTGPNNIVLRWTPLNLKPLIGYAVFYQLVNASWTITFESVCTSGLNNSLELFNLQPSANYILQIAGFTGYQVGPKSDSIMIRTQRQPLNRPPTAIEAYAWSTTSAYVSWSPVSFESLRGYVIFYKALAPSSRRKRRSVPDLTELNVTVTSVEQNSSFLSGLNEFYNYSVEASGFTDFELGPRTNTVYIFTNQTVPRVPPANVKLTSIDSTTIQVCWDIIPHFPNLEEYEVRYMPSGQTNTSAMITATNANATSAILNALSFSIIYTVSVAGKTQDGLGPFSSPETIQPTNYTVPRITAFPRGNSTIFVCWPNDVIASSLEIAYVNVGGNLTQHLNVDASKSIVKIDTLDIKTNYSIQIHLRGGCGGNQTSEAVYVKTGGQSPLKPPKKITLNSTSSSTVQVEWQPNPSPLVEAYAVRYRQVELGNTVKIDLVNASNLTAQLSGLKAFTRYGVALHTVTWCKNGSRSKESFVVTDGSVPSHPPVNVTGQGLTSTSLFVSWSPVPLEHRSGIILGYNLSYWKANESSNTNVTLTTDEEEIEIDGLEMFTPYMVAVSAFNQIGDGVFSDPIQIWTDEDVPSLPPQDLVAENHTTLSTIPVFWSAIPAENVHGILRKYRLRFTPVLLADRTVLNGKAIVKVVSNETMSIVLDGLDRYTVYRIEVWGETVKGGGSVATTFAETCDCHKRFTTNWMFFPPYVDQVTSSSTPGSPIGGIGIGGIIPPIIVDMVSACCRSCKSHGESYVDFNAQGASQHITYNDMLERISPDIDFSFPVSGFKGQTDYKNYYSFLDLVESPGVAHVINTANTSQLSILGAILSTWPIAVFTILSVYLSGVVAWALERKDNAEQFTPSFIRGAGEGAWWSYMSATTVGYGDKAPVTYNGRLFSVLWILMGLVIIGIFNGSITTAITTFSLTFDFSLYGKTVAAVTQTPEYRLGLKKNAKFANVTYTTFRQVFTDLDNGNVTHALFDTYAIGSEKALFEGANHLQIYQIYDYSFTYGIVMGGESKVLQKCFKMFKKRHIEDIFTNIKDNIDSIRPGKDLALELSTGLFDISSPLFKNTLVYCGIALAIATFAGVIWEILYRCKENNKVKSEGLDDTEETLKHFKRMREMLEDFYQRMHQITADLKAKHIEEFVHLRKLRKEMDCDGDQKTGGNYNDLTVDVQAFLRSRLGPPRSYEVGSNPGSRSFEQYFDNLDLGER